MRDHLWTPHGALVSEGLDNNAFLWQPAVTLAKTTSYDEAPHINALTKVDGVAQVHDGRGNRTGAAGRTWRYDSRNMLVGANAPGMAASYGYYPEGGRAWKQVNGVTTLYLELDGVEWGSYDAAGTLKERTIRASGAGGAVVAVHSPAGGLIRLLPNRQGSVIGWLRPDGKLGGAYSYDAYGNSAQAGAAGPSFRYAGMRFDAETGLYHTPNRAYDPQDGRWMQLDPIGIKDGLNRYAYVRNSPVNAIDPTGTDAVAIVFPNYEIAVGGEKYKNIGHAGILLINSKSGATSYYEFGRYAPTTGVVRSFSVPNVVMGSDGMPTNKSLERAMNVISQKAGHSGAIEGAYIKDADFDRMQKYASGLLNKSSDQSGYGDWSLYNSCATFAQETLEAGGVDTPSMWDPRPNSYIKKLQGMEGASSVTLSQFQGTFRVTGRLDSKALDKEIEKRKGK